MNILPRITSTHWRLVRKIVTRTVQQRLASGAIIPKNSVVKHTDKDSIPDNVVILGVELDKVESCRKLRHLPPVPDDCEIIRKPRDCPQHRVPPRIWLDSFESVEFTPTTALELHPEVFGCNPRIDYLNQCKEWQKNFKEVDYTWEPTRAEVGFGKKKPWPQKGLGRARHGSTNAPQWKGGGVAHGHRGPKTLYQKILPHVRLGALTSALTIKLHQNNLSVVNDFSIPSPDKEGLHEILAARNMVENSVLLVYSDNENFEDSINIFSAVEYWPEVNLMPLVALNVWSLLHHDLLVITRAALDELEEKVVWNLHRYNWIDKPHNFYRDLPFTVKHSLTET